MNSLRLHDPSYTVPALRAVLRSAEAPIGSRTVAAVSASTVGGRSSVASRGTSRSRS